MVLKIDYNVTTKWDFWGVFGVIDYNPYYKMKRPNRVRLGLVGRKYIFSIDYRSKIIFCTSVKVAENIFVKNYSGETDCPLLFLLHNSLLIFFKPFVMGIDTAIRPARLSKRVYLSVQIEVIITIIDTPIRTPRINNANFFFFVSNSVLNSSIFFLLIPVSSLIVSSLDINRQNYFRLILYQNNRHPRYFQIDLFNFYSR